MKEPQTPADLREGVRRGIISSIRSDVELRGGRTARRLLAAGFVGSAGGVGATLLATSPSFGHHPHLHLSVFAAAWTGLLIVNVALVFLQVRTPSLPLAHAASVGIVGLGLAGLAGTLCPDAQFLGWWMDTEAGALLVREGGAWTSALGFGLLSGWLVGAVSAFVMLGSRGHETSPLLAAGMLFLLLAPGVALQSVGMPLAVFGTWMAGTAGGAYLGVAGGTLVRRRLRSR